MDREIKPENRIPGCDRLTRPEDVKGMSKFLGELKKVKEDQISNLVKDVLEVPGRVTGGINKVNDLDNTYITLDNNSNNNLNTDREDLTHAQTLSIDSNIVDLDVNSEVSLNPDKFELNIDDISSLDPTLESIKLDSELNLDTKSENLSDTSDVSNLYDTLLGLEIEEIEGLNKSIEDLSIEELTSINDDRLEFNVEDKVENLSSDLIELESSNILNLDSTLHEFIDPNTLELEDEVDKINVDEVNSLEYNRISIDSDQVSELSDNLINLENSKEVSELNDSIESLQGHEIEDFNDKLELLENVDEIDKNLNVELENIIVPNLDNLYEDTVISPDVLPEDIIKTPVVIEKIYPKDIETLPKDTNTISIEEGPDDLLLDLEGLPKYQRPEFSDDTNINTWIRQTVEGIVNSIGGNTTGKVRQFIIDEALATTIWGRDELEKLTKSNKDRLPGNDFGPISDLVSGGVSEVVSNIGSYVASDMSPKKDPINRPSYDDYNTKSTTGWQRAHSLIDSSNVVTGDSSIIKRPWGTENYLFKDNYLRGTGISTTLSELCEVNSITDIETVEDLFSKLRQSPYVTTPEKFTTTGKGNFKTFMLDTNSYWEIIFRPYVGVFNGQKSFLPAIEEINTINEKINGVRTNYTNWIPFTSFDLQKARLSTKSLNLYDGDIMFPVSMDFINEFRLTIADDQYKSWRYYFERCAQAAIYNSKANDQYWYSPSGTANNSINVTSIDKSNICIAPYKNVTFRCTVYMMSPQYSTLKKFDLLLILKDFTEEAYGEIDSSGTDLTLSFSIVGENPISDVTPYGVKMSEPTVTNPKKDWSTIIEGTYSSLIELI